MTISLPQTAGPNIVSGTEIKFSTLRKYFLKMKPRRSFGGSDEDFGEEPETGSVSASQLLRVSSLDGIDDRPIDEQTRDRREIKEEYDIDYLLPYVPDCIENSNIATKNNWKTSQFVGSVKYYYLRQSATDDLNVNLSTTDHASWNGNLPFTIRKWFFIDGTIGSNTNTDGTKSLASLIIPSATNYLTLKLSSTGKIYGSSGAAGTNGVNEGKGGDGGDAISWTDPDSRYNNYVFVHTKSQIYGGGGGGGKGGNGGRGGNGAQGGNHNIGCNGIGAGGYNCTQNRTGGGSGGSTSIGPDGPAGRGYSNLDGLLDQILGGTINGGGGKGCYHVGCAGAGGDSGKSGSSGSAGDWAEDGNEEDSTDGTSGKNGGSGSLQGHCAVCGGNNLGHHNRCCHSMTTGSGGSGSGGTAGAEGGARGKAIVKGPATSFKLIGEAIDNIKGTYTEVIGYALPWFLNANGSQIISYYDQNTGIYYSNTLVFANNEDIIDTLEESISTGMHVVCSQDGIISLSTKIANIQRYGNNYLHVTVTPLFNAYVNWSSALFNFYS